MSRTVTLDAAWLALLGGDLEACASRLADAIEDAAAAAARAERWDDELDEALSDLSLAGSLARAGGQLGLAARAQGHRLTLARVHEVGRGDARGHVVGAVSELAYLDDHRCRPLDGRARLEAVFAERAGADDAEDAEEHAFLGERLDYVARRLGSLRDAPDASDDDAPAPDVGAEVVRESAGDHLGWPAPPDAPLDVPGSAGPGLAALWEAYHAVWEHVGPAREAARRGEHAEALAGYDEAIRSAEAMSSAFRGCWFAREQLFVAVVGRANELGELGERDESVRAAELAVGIVEDQARATPEVRSLEEDRAWALARLGWLHCELDDPADEVLAANAAAIAAYAALRARAARNPTALYQEMRCELHAGVHLGGRRHVRAAWGIAWRAASLRTELRRVMPDYEPLARAVAELRAQATAQRGVRGVFARLAAWGWRH